MIVRFKGLSLSPGWVLVVLICVVPLARWAMLAPVGVRWDGLVAVMSSLGQMAGITGLILFSLNMVLAMRLRVFEDWFGGLNRVFIAHHIIGGSAFIALLMHPLFLALRLAPVSMREAALFLVPSLDNLPVAFGITALLGLITLLVLTFFVTLRYRVWLLTHKLLGAVFLLAGLHVLLTPNDLSADGFLRWYLLGFVGLGLAAYVYRTLLPDVFARRYEYVVKSVRPLNATTVEVAMAPKGQPMMFEAGQFVFVSFRAPGLSREWHPFSISMAADGSGTLAITVKSQGVYTRALISRVAALPGARVRIEGAYGRFRFRDMGGTDQIWIAGGIGITPFLALAKSLTVKELRYRVDLYYSVQTEAELVGADVLSQAVGSWPERSLRVIPFISNKQGLLTAGYINSMSRGLAGKEILVCGPPPMMRALEKQFLALGVDRKHIHTEEFRLT